MPVLSEQNVTYCFNNVFKFYFIAIYLEAMPYVFTTWQVSELLSMDHMLIKKDLNTTGLCMKEKYLILDLVQ